jgi:hypothetical protein
MPSYPGRPREFSHQRRRELIDHIYQGATLEEAARIVSVSLRTVQREAKHNEFFHHDLHLALHAAPADPEKLVRRAARTHWRAAAWLLERTHPDRFAKRPPNSCSPATLMDISNWLIETALEATPPDHRAAVYDRMRAVADKAVELVMPDQHDARRSLLGELPQRPMPLSDHEVVKQLLDNRDCPAPALSLPEGAEEGLTTAPSAGEDRAAKPALGPDAVPAVPAATCVADPVAFYRTHPPQKPPAGRPSETMAGFRLLDSDLMDAEELYPLPSDEEEDADDADDAEAMASSESSSAPASATSANSGQPGVRSPERGNYVAKNERGDKGVPCPRPRGHGDKDNAMARVT